MVNHLHTGLILFLFMVACCPLLAQKDSTAQAGTYVDQTDLLQIIRGDKQLKNGKKDVEDGKLLLFIVPIIGANPTLGTFFGVGGTAAKYLGSPENTSISNLVLSMQYTTKNQFIASTKGTILTPGNKWELLVDLKYAIFANNNYGLGSDYNQPIKESWNIGGIQTSGIEGPQPMTFNQVKLYFTALRSVKKGLYVGMGYHLDLHYNIEDLSLDLEAQNPVLTSHYSYSTFYGFDTDQYATSGINLDVVNDNRDNLINTYEGRFLQASYSINPVFLGSAQFNQQLYLEARLFKSVSATVPRNVIGFWTIARFTLSGQAPYLHLPASGGDMRNRIGRGYVVDRFRGPSWITSEVEYRFRISSNGLIGGVLFGSLTSASRPGFVVGTTTVEKLHLFEAIRPAGGFGARIMLDKNGRMNFGADMAFGQNGAKGLYLVIAEAF